MTFKSALIAFFAASVAFSGTAYAAPKTEKNEDRQAILITAFGTSMPSARKAIDNLVGAAKKAFPAADVRLAFTSNIIRRKLKREGKKNVPPTPVQALAQLNDEGFKKVCVMPTHIIPGAEYDEIKNVVEAWGTLKGKYGIPDLRLGKAFLSSVEACDEMAAALVARFSAVSADTAVVLMGHGTPHHIANAMYSQLQVALDKAADGRFFIGTVENTPLIGDVTSALKKAGYRKALLSPLMIVAGDHANNDMADASDPESWYSILSGEGIAVGTMIKGLGEDEGIAAAFVAHLKDALK